MAFIAQDVCVSEKDDYVVSLAHVFDMIQDFERKHTLRRKDIIRVLGICLDFALWV